MASKPEEELSDDHERCDDASPPAPTWLDQFGEQLSSLMEQAFPPELREVEGGIVNKTVQDLWDNSVERSKLIAANEAAAAHFMCMAQKKDADMTQFEERLTAAAAAVAQMRGGR